MVTPCSDPHIPSPLNTTPYLHFDSYPLSPTPMLHPLHPSVGPIAAPPQRQPPLTLAVPSHPHATPVAADEPARRGSWRGGRARGKARGLRDSAGRNRPPAIKPEPSLAPLIKIASTPFLPAPRRAQGLRHARGSAGDSRGPSSRADSVSAGGWGSVPLPRS